MYVRVAYGRQRFFEISNRFRCSTDTRRSRRRGPDGQEMLNIDRMRAGNTCIPIGSGRYSDEESDLPPAKRARDNTIISDYEDLWNTPLRDDRPIILTPPSLVSISPRNVRARSLSALWGEEINGSR